MPASEKVEQLGGLTQNANNLSPIDVSVITSVLVAPSTVAMVTQNITVSDGERRELGVRESENEKK